MASSLGIKEIVLLIVLFVIIFGAKRLPELGRSLGRGMRELRDGIAGNAKGMMMLINRESGKGMGVTLFETEDDLKRGDEALNEMSPGGGGRRASVEVYEVAVQRM